MRFLWSILLLMIPLHSALALSPAQIAKLKWSAKDQYDLVAQLSPYHVLARPDLVEEALEELEELFAKPAPDRYLSTYIALVQNMAQADAYLNPETPIPLPYKEWNFMRKVRARIVKLADTFVGDGNAIASFRPKYADENVQERKNLSQIYQRYTQLDRDKAKRTFHSATTIKYAVLALKLVDKINAPTVRKLHTVHHTFRATQIRYAVNQVMMAHHEALPTPGSGCPGSLEK